MAKKTLITLFLIFLFLVPTILAYTTDITVKTKSDHKLLIQQLSPDDNSVIQSFSPYKHTGTLGRVKVSLTTSNSKISLKLDLITTEGTPDINYIYSDIPATGEPVFINFLPGNFTYTVGIPVVITPNVTNITANNLTNETVINETNQTPPATAEILNETNKTSTLKSNFSITGFVSKFYENNSKTFFYILIVIGVIVGILIIIFIVRKIPRKPSENFTIRHRSSDTTSSPSNSTLMSAEKKLKEAQQQIESIKKKNESIRDAERKLEEDRIRLDKLKRTY